MHDERQKVKENNKTLAARIKPVNQTSKVKDGSGKNGGDSNGIYGRIVDWKRMIDVMISLIKPFKGLLLVQTFISTFEISALNRDDLDKK